MDKEQIIIDGEKYNKCNGCKLWDGYICTGDRSYEPNAEAHRAICNEHIAKEFWKVYHELFYKTQECEQLQEKYEALKLENQEGYEIVAELKQECEELKRKVELMMDCPDCKVDEYKKALEEIENNINKYFEEAFYKNCRYAKGCTSACGLATNRVFNKILDIINKAKGEGNEE